MRAWVFALAVGLAGGCDDAAPRAAAPPAATTPASSPPTAPAVVPLEPAVPAALAQHGAELLAAHECVRCHAIQGIAPTTDALDCVGCHRAIVAGTLAVPPDELAGYQSRVHSLVDVPSLAAGPRFRRAWIADFLADTHDLRPNLEPSMPRFALPRADVEAIAAFLAPEAERTAPALGDATRGRAIAAAKGCGTCHRFSGAEALPATPPPITIEPAALALGQRLAPDLAHARARMHAATLVDWLADPAAVSPGTAMPRIPMEPQEILDVAAYLLQTPLRAVAAEPMPERLPILARAVSYEEVDARIFHRTCRHCHSDPEQVIGDGGPGYSGGFGFPKRGLDLNSYEGIRSGSIGDDGARRSLFEVMPDGTPRIVAHLWARHAEIAGAPVDGVRGMPLGLPAVLPEDIQLLETWIAQGRKPAGTVVAGAAP